MMSQFNITQGGGFAKVKPLITSKVFWGVVLMLGGSILPGLVSVTSDELATTAGLLMDAAGAALAIYGRVTTNSKIGGVLTTATDATKEG